MKRFNSVLSRLNKNKNIIVLQDASIALVPMILTVTVLLMVTEGSALFSISFPYAESVRNIHYYFYIFFPLIFTVSLSMAFVKSKEIDATSLVLICFSLLFLSLADGFETFIDLKESIFFNTYWCNLYNS